MVWPLKLVTSNDFCTYVEFAFRFEYVASVVRTVPLVLRICTFSVSYAVVVVVSEVSMCSQNVSVPQAFDGIATCWYSESVCVVPYPSSHASHVPECGGSPWLPYWPMTPDVWVHDAAPDSNPGLATMFETPHPPLELTVSETDVECVADVP